MTLAENHTTLAEKFALMMTITNGMEDDLRSSAVDEFGRLIVNSFEQDNFHADIYQDGSILVGTVDDSGIGHLWAYKNKQEILEEINSIAAHLANCD